MSAIKSMIIRTRSHRALQDVSDAPSTEEISGGGCERSCWAKMPQELLREVLIRIESSESNWPQRRNVVAVAGVCRIWRYIVKDLVKVPEHTTQLTFPISLKQPGPRDSVLQCFIRRCRSSQTYYLYLGLTNALADDGKFLLAAGKYKRTTCTEYIISLSRSDMSKGSSVYVGKLRSNFLGNKFTVFDGQPPQAGAKMSKSRSTRLVNFKQVSPRVPAGSYPVSHISYELNVLGSRGPRRMHCVMDSIPATAVETGGVAPTPTELSHDTVGLFSSLPTLNSKSISEEDFQSGPLPQQRSMTLVLRNKVPRWHEQLQCWCLNFNGRVTVASVKNFQLVASPENGPAGSEHEKIILQFGKIGKDLFTMDYRYPVSAFQAFAICLSSFDTKIACER